MNSDMLDQVGLLNMMKLEVTRLRQFNHLAVHFVNDGAEPELDKDQRLMSFRIFQEIMNNTLRHAEAKNIYVSLKGAGRFEFEIRDDGKGFDVKRELREGKGSGLRNIIKRAGLADLSCNIVAENSKGSIFTLAQNIKVSA
jgi:signal transduction histidine kinase